MAVVQFDVDGVLAAFLDGYRAVQRTLGQPETWSLKWDDYWNPEVWSVIRDDAFFWEGLPALASRAEFKRIDSLHDQHDVYFVTHRVGKYPKAQTEHWLMSRGVSRPTVVVTKRKGEFAASVRATHAIEDKAGSAVYTAYQSPETRSYLLDKPYNQFDRDVLGSKVARVDSVSEFLDQVEAA